jgi:hypothetical protein
MTSENKVEYNNEYILSRIEEQQNLKKKYIIEELKIIAPSLSNDELLTLYTKSISIHQGKIQRNGSFLENDILVKMLDENGVYYKQQVTIDKCGIIVGFNERKRGCFHILDFVIGENIEIGKSITEYKVVSCKTTCRERWTQDDWSHMFKPILYILLTLSDDYPPSSRFRKNKKK